MADWYWAPYNTIAQEQGRKIETFSFFNSERKFNYEDFGRKAAEILRKQDRLVIILNTPAHNPTGYSLTEEDWQKVKLVLLELPADKKVALLVDTGRFYLFLRRCLKMSFLSFPTACQRHTLCTE